MDAVLCVSSSVEKPLEPKPILARSVEEVLQSGGVKPMLSPNLLPLEELWQASFRDFCFFFAMLGLFGIEVLSIFLFFSPTLFPFSTGAGRRDSTAAVHWSWLPSASATCGRRGPCS